MIEFKNNKGIRSYCEIDKKNNYFIKYYFEIKNDKLYDLNFYEVINNKKLNLKRFREIDITKYISNIKELNNFIPKYFFNLSYKINFNSNIFKKIIKHNEYNKDNIQFYKLVSNYLSFNTLYDYFINDDNYNNISNKELINIYKQIFKIIFIFIKNNIIPYDLINMTNLLYDKENKKIYIIDYANYCYIKNKLTKKDIIDIFIYYMRYTLDINFNNNKHLFKILLKEKNLKQIIFNSLKDLIEEKIIEQIYNDIFINYNFIITKDNLIKNFLGEKNLFNINILDVFKLCLYNNDKFQIFRNNIKDKLLKNNIDFDYLQNLRFKFNDMYNFFNKYNFNKLEFDYILMIIYNYNIPKIISNLIIVLQNEIKYNKCLTLYYKKSNPLIGVNKNSINENDINKYCKIKTNKYLKLIPYNTSQSFKSKYINFYNQDDKYFFKSFYKKEIKFINNQYLLFNFNFEDYILNWSGFVDNTHYHTHWGLTLYSLDNKLFNTLYSNASKLSKEDYYNQFDKPNLNMKLYMNSIYESQKRNINFEKEFNNLVNFINNNKKQYNILYRGEKRYEKTTFNNKLNYKNIHTFSTDKNEAIKFLSNYYFGFDENIKEYNLFILHKGYASKINPIGYNNFKFVTEWVEYLHIPFIYNIISIKQDNITIKYKDNIERNITYNIIDIQE